jgi:hypothetical protein
LKRIALYRYHNNLDFCVNRIEFFRFYNPGIPVYGLFGGDEIEYQIFENRLDHLLDGNFCIRGQSTLWKWKNGDLAIRLWYKDYGCYLDFDSVIMLEWDLIFLDSVELVYSGVSENQVGMTGLIPLKEIEKIWYWTRNKIQKQNWQDLLQYVMETYGYSQEPMAGLCPGLMLPRKFLDDYSSVEIPALCHDELRIPLFAQVLGYELVDLGFYRKWFSKKESQYFNCNDFPISLKTIQREYVRENGRRVFHPFRELISTDEFEKVSINLYSRLIAYLPDQYVIRDNLSAMKKAALKLIKKS